MLRNISHIILTFLLLSATTGMAVSKHFCGEYLISVSLFSNPDTCCDDGNCCHNESSFYHLDENFSAPGFLQLPGSIDIELLVDMFGQFITLYSHEKPVALILEGDLPPPPKIQTLLSLKQAFLL